MPEPGEGLRRAGSGLQQTLQDVRGLSLEVKKKSDTIKGGTDIGALVGGPVTFVSYHYSSAGHLARVRSSGLSSEDSYWILVRSLPLECTPGYLESIEREKTPGTCRWIHDVKEFTSWVNDDKQFLWLLGGSGTGKTMLTAHIIDHIRQRVENAGKGMRSNGSSLGDEDSSGLSSKPDTFAYCFCDAGDSRRRTAGGIVGALMRQLLLHHWEILKETDELLAENLKVASYNTDALLGALREMLKGLGSRFRNIFIIIDGLDACDITSGKIFIGGLRILLGKTKTKLLVTSQPVEWIVDELRDIKEIVEPLDIKPLVLKSGDINTMIRHKFPKLHLERYLKDKEVVRQLHDHLINDSEGTFLWADLVMKSLDLEATKGKLSNLNFHQILQKFSGSRTLQGPYDRILSDICRRRVEGGLTLDEVEFVLQLVAVAKRPLTPVEIDTAYAVWKRGNHRAPILPNFSEIQKDIHESCIPLVSLNSETKVVTLMHKSAAQYLLGGRSYLLLKTVRYLGVLLSVLSSLLNKYNVVVSLQLIHIVLFLSALGGSFRLSGSGSSSLTSQSTRRYRKNLTMANSLALDVCLIFLGIESLNWGAKELGGDGENPERSKPEGSTSFVGYVAEYWLYHVLAIDPDYAACHVRKLRKLPNLQVLRDHLLLHAAKHGQAEVMRVLLREMGASSRVADDEGRTALHFAAVNGYLDAVRTLIEYGADLDARDSIGAAALHWAAGGAQLETFTELFGLYQQQRRSRTTKYMGGWSSQVQRSLRSRRVVKNLPDAEMADDSGGTLMAWAVEGGSERVVEFLLSNGAKTDVVYIKDIRRFVFDMESLSTFNTSFEEWVELYYGLLMSKQSSRTPVARAAELGQRRIVELLIHHGADPEFRDEAYRTPIFWAAKRRDQTITQLLTSRGAKCDPQLRLATIKGDREVVKGLLDLGGADPNWQDESGVSVVGWAAVAGDRSVMEALLESPKVDVNFRATEMRVTPLIFAAFFGKKDVVEALLKRNADLNITDIFDMTPLMRAAMRGFDEIVEIILASNKANLTTKCCTGATALMAAAGPVSESNFRLLMQKDRNLGRRDYLGRSAIFYAIREGNRQVIDVLLSQPSVDTTIADFYGSTPVSMAARFGDNETLKKLFRRSSSETSASQLMIRDKFGRSPVMWAASNGHSATKKLLLVQYKTIGVPAGSDAFIPVTVAARPASRGAQKPREAFCDVCFFNIGDPEPYYTCDRCFSGTYVCCSECWTKLRPRPSCFRRTHRMRLRERSEDD